MAKIKFGSVITDSRGHIAGTTFKWTRNGNVSQRLVRPTLHLSPAAQRTKASFESYTRRWWSTLTPTQRTDWRALAAANPRPNTWGDEFPLTGHALFIAVNTVLVKANFAGIDDAPADQTVTAMTTATITATAPDELILTWTPSPLPANHGLYIFGRANFSPGILNSSRRSAFLLATDDSETSTLDVGPQFAAAFGPIITTRQQLLEVALLNSTNGALSTPITALAIAS